MRPETIRLAQVLLDWHAQLQARNKSPDTVTPADLIPYKRLCQNAGLPGLARIVGEFLDELADWCREHELPPLSSLAVSAIDRKPGPGSSYLPGRSEIQWWRDVQACIGAKYPERIP